MSKRNRHRQREAQSGSTEKDSQVAGDGADGEEGGEEETNAGDAAAEAKAGETPVEAKAEEPAAGKGGEAPAGEPLAAAMAAGGAALAVAAAPVEPPAIAPAILDPLVERLRAGRCVLVAGNGLESTAGMPTYRQLLERMLMFIGETAEVADARQVLDRRPFVTAGFIRRRLGDRFLSVLRDASVAPAEVPEPFKLLGQLPFRAVVSTGYSDILTRAFSRDGLAPPVYTLHDAADLKRDSRKRFILKVLGEPSRPETVIWTSQEIQQALSLDAYRDVVHHLFKNRSLLFLGFSAEDIELLFTRLFAGAHSEATHYAVLPRLSRLEADDLQAVFNIRALDVAELPVLIRALRDALGDFNADAPPDDDDIEGWVGVLSQEPDRADARDKLDALEKRLREGDQHERLMELHLAMIEVETLAQARGRRLREVAKILEEKVGDLGKSFTALVESFKEDPTPEVRGELERLAAATGLWTDLVTEYTQLIPTLKQETRAEHWLHVAVLYGDKVGHADYALSSVEEALKIDPILGPALEMKVKLLRNAERWKELAVALGVRAEHEASPAARFEMYLEQADLFESRLHDGPSAIKAYRAALAAEPGNPEALSALEQLYRRHSDFAPLLGVLDEKIAAVASTDAARAVELRKEAAALASEKLGDRKGAITRYEALRADGHGDLAVWKALEHLYDAEGRAAEYLEVLELRTALVTDDKERLALYRRLAAEWEERPSGQGRAAEYLEKLLVIDPKNEEALRAVERLYGGEQKWEALVDAYRRHVELPGADKVALSVEIARVYDERIDDPARAITAWSRVLELSAENDDALAALGRLHQKTGSWPRALELLDQRAELTKDKEAKVNLHFEAGRLCAEKLGDPKAAEVRYARAHGVDPTHVASMVAMVELYRKAGEFLRAAKLLVEAEEHTANRLEKTRMLVEAGELYAALDEHKPAADLYLKALAVDPEHVEAGGRVADLLWKEERWAELVPVLEMLTRKEADRETQRERWVRLGRAAKAIGAADKASRAYSKAAEIDPTDLEAQRALSEMLYKDGKWLEAREAFASVLHHHHDDLQPPERVDLFYHLGECARRLGHVDKAKNFYGKALEIDPTHRPTILAQIDVGAGNPQQVIEAKRALLVTASPEESLKLLTEIGDLYQEKLSDPEQAVATFREALGMKPDSRALMHRCLDVHVQQKDWRKALEMLERLTEAEPLATVRAKLRYTRAIIHRDEIQESDAAIKLWNEAIDDDPAATKALEKLEEILERTENWKELQRFHRKAVKRMAAEVDGDTPEQRRERLRSWSRIAELSLEKLGEVEVGIAALEVASSLDRGDLKRHEQLADLYVQAGPSWEEKAINEHQTLLRHQHDRVASYRALRALYPKVRQTEKALAVAYALSLLKKGDAEDQKMVAEAKLRPLQPARRNLDDETWSRYVAHPDEDRVVDALFAQVQSILSVANGRAHKDVPLNRKEKLEATDPRTFSKAVRYVANALDAKLSFESYVRYEQREAIVIANCVDKQQPVPCLIFGGPMMGEKRPERELLFELGKRLAYFRPERSLRFVLPAAPQLALIIDAGIALGAEADSGKPAGGEAGKKAQELKRALPPKTLEQVVFFGRKLVGQRGDQLAAAWLAATELTATRAAFLLLGDLEQTARLVAAEPPTVSTLPATHRLKELIWFTVTEDCFAARKHLGLMA